jgi:glycosyltransferase involved in cell wall biosynthesis
VLVVGPYPPRRCGIGAYVAAQVERLRDGGSAVVVLSPADGAGDLRVRFVGGAALRRAAAMGRTFDRIVVHYETGIWFRPRSPVTHVLTAASLLWLVLRRAQTEILIHEAREPPSLVRPDYALLRLAFARATLRFHTLAERDAFEAAYGIRARATLTKHADGVVVHTSMSRTRARAKLGFEADGPLFVCAGFLLPDKGFDRAVGAFAAAGSPGRLVLIGSVRDDTPENRAYALHLRTLAEPSENVTFIERYASDEEFDAWVSAADVLVLPYRRAWSSGALARAQRIGTPAFVSDTGGLAEQAGDDDRVFGTDDELAELMRERASGSPPGTGGPGDSSSERERASGSPPGPGR